MLINISQLAAALGVSIRTIRRWYRSGKLPQPRRIGAQKVFDLGAVRASIELQQLRIELLRELAAPAFATEKRKLVERRDAGGAKELEPAGQVNLPITKKMTPAEIESHRSTYESTDEADKEVALLRASQSSTDAFGNMSVGRAGQER